MTHIVGCKISSTLFERCVFCEFIERIIMSGGFLNSRMCDAKSPRVKIVDGRIATLSDSMISEIIQAISSLSPPRISILEVALKLLILRAAFLTATSSRSSVGNPKSNNRISAIKKVTLSRSRIHIACTVKG
jgi:hypothetical protein